MKTKEQAQEECVVTFSSATTTFKAKTQSVEMNAYISSMSMKNFK